MKPFLRLVVSFTGMLLLSVSIGAQAVIAQPATCPALVERALRALEDNCSEMGRNSVCYGYTLVEATFDEGIPPDLFATPSDRAELAQMRTLRTSALNLTDEFWGIAVMHVQANLPNTLPGQAVTFLVMGDADVENAVAADEAVTGAEPVTFTLARDADARALAGPAAPLITRLRAGETLAADAQNRTLAWLRVVVNGRAAWVERSAVNPDPALDALPVVTADTRGPMQAFYFRTGIGQPECVQAPDIVTVQSPDGLTVELNVNGVDVRVSSRIAFRSLSDNRAVFVTLEGTLELVDGTIVRQGEALEVTTDDEGNIISLEVVRPATPEEMQLEQTVNPFFESIVLPTTPPPPLFTELGELIHIVVRGDTLFSIARFYQASMAAIISRNNLVDPRSIFVGQRLVIPNPGSGFIPVSLPTEEAAPELPPEIPPDVTGSCSDFRLVAPTDGLNFGFNTFIWTPLEGATSYRVVVNNLSEAGSAIFTAAAPATEARGLVDQTTVGWGFNFSFNVQALRGDQVLCQTETVSIQREPVNPVDNVPPQAPLAPNFTAIRICSGIGIAVVTWSGAPVGAALEIKVTDVMGTSLSFFPTGEAGSTTVTPGTDYEIGSIEVVLLTTGQLIDVGGCS
ncbi:MAG: LysM peptidoglycan-binding domain-containing protein [Chloroflexota bacterium]